MAEKEPNDNTGSSMRGYAKYSALGFQMIAVIGIFTYAGYKITIMCNGQPQRWHWWGFLYHYILFSGA
jgi:hypothetical protein